MQGPMNIKFSHNILNCPISRSVRFSLLLQVYFQQLTSLIMKP